MPARVIVLFLSSWHSPSAPLWFGAVAAASGETDESLHLLLLSLANERSLAAW